ncbi:toll/interleukin-1 receptor domain-containing protein [Marinomonas shanghaiensis]|uniref:toll/interleukin-1 receptor domain-containing protein n=1 Tax=Marinomonas shanghaiensis TaxID=2202418 RepID=UPI003A94658F
MSGIKVFISHQKQDSEKAIWVQNYLKTNHGIECYLDVIDLDFEKGEEIADYVRKELDKCSHFLVVMSSATKNSWWVPWEIGVATEKDYPLASYGDNVALPEFLMKWPYLRSSFDLKKYAEAIKETKVFSGFSLEDNLSESVTASSGSSTKQFYRTLRSKLGQ